MTTELDFTDTPPAGSVKGINLSPQQAKVIDWVKTGKGNAVIEAVAGSGKTSTLIEALSQMNGSVAFAAYNKRIADEIAEKVSLRGVNAQVATFHAFGYRAWRNSNPSVELEQWKVRNLVEKETFDGDAVPRPLQTFVVQLVSLAKQAGIGIISGIGERREYRELIDHHGLEDLLTGRKPWEAEVQMDPDALEAAINQGISWAIRILNASILLAETVVDFDDMLYMPLFDKACPIAQYDWVLIDEAQDANVTRRLLAAAMLKPTGRLIAVGDRHQAIFGFTGADSESLTNIAEMFQCDTLDLTVSFRCPRDVVDVARQFVSHIEPHESAGSGRVLRQSYDKMVQDIMNTETTQLSNAAVICRKNAPLVDIAFMLLRERIPCHVVGRDIGAQIINLANKWRVTFLEDLVKKVQDYRHKQVARAIEQGAEGKADAIADRCDTLIALANGLLDEDKDKVQDLVDLCKSLFTDENKGGLPLSTIHKAKGMEWDRVYWLGANKWQPSPFAVKTWQLEQEINLQYVAATRAKQDLVIVAVD